MTELTPSSYREWKDWRLSEFGRLDLATCLYYDAEARRSGLGSLAGQRILESGFSNGSFAAWVRERGAIYSGTELIAELLSAARNAGLDVYSGYDSLRVLFPPESIELIVAFGVFEHLRLDQLKALLGEARTCLRQSGLLIARVPSGDSPFTRAIQNGDLTHQIALGSAAKTQLASETGFEFLQIREPAFPVRGLGPKTLARRVGVRIARRLAYPFISRALMANSGTILTPNMVFVLRKPSATDPADSPATGGESSATKAQSAAEGPFASMVLDQIQCLSARMHLR
jgi:SAM-dependent methyltransferase